jgi:hypothetical protein
MVSPSNKPWLQILAEGTAIMLSILLAFGIEAWWAERGERLEEREVMHGLETEFSAYHERLIRDASRGEVAQRLLAEVLAAGPPGFSNALPVSAADSSFFYMVVVPTFDVEGGTLDALLTSGRLELIQDLDLRARLASWPGLIADIRDNELATREFVIQVAHPLFSEYGVPLGRASEAVHEGSWPTQGVPGADASSTYSQILRDPRFSYVVSQRYMMTANSAREYAAAAESAEGLLALIRDALEGSDGQN